MDHRKIACKKSSNQFLSLSKKDGWRLWLIEVIYSIKRNVLWFNGIKESNLKKNQGPDSRDEKVDPGKIARKKSRT